MESLGCQAKEPGLDLEGNGTSDTLEPTCFPPCSCPGPAQWRASVAFRLPPDTAGCLSHPGESAGFGTTFIMPPWSEGLKQL